MTQKYIAFDTHLVRPGCVIVAAGMGTDTKVVQEFDAQDWLVAPTPHMRAYPFTDDMIPELVARVRACRKDTP